MTSREREASGRAALRWLATAIALYLVAVLPVHADLAFTIQPTTKDALGANLPATGPGALLSHRVEYGTCNGAAFGTSLGNVVVTMPTLSGTFVAPIGLYCVRATPTNSFGVGAPYPVAIIGPVPSGGGTIVVLSQSP